MRILQQEDFWTEIDKEVQMVIKGLLEGCAEKRFREQIGLAKYERGDNRPDYRNGYRYRGLQTGRFGYIENVKIPRGRNGKYEYKIFRRYHRRSTDCDEAIFTYYLLGHSTRDISKTFTKVFRDTLSHSAVSHVLKQLDRYLYQYRQEIIQDTYKMLVMDGLWLHVKTPSKLTTKAVVLVVMGIKEDGSKRILGYKCSSGESLYAWEGLINDLYKRGLRADQNTIIIHDGSPGLQQAIDAVFPYADKQLCVFHHISGINRYLKHESHRDAILKDAKRIYHPHQLHAINLRYYAFLKKWLPLEPSAVAYFRKHFSQTLTYLKYPKRFWPYIKTTNHIERSFREMNRKVYDVCVFPSAQSCERLLYLWIANFNYEQERICPK
jgi:putative transposase